ncbi:MAG: hypothetical protein KF900_10570 [Bacteroidetes bacterium]|nr:hypothetical protein [Bacteroidota bacterium]
MNNVIKIAAMAVLIIGGCKKEKTVIVKEPVTIKEPVTVKEDGVPTADFTTGKSDYKGGETLVLKNSSLKAASVRWTLPDGTTAKTDSVSWVTDTAGYEQTFQFKLEAISQNGTKSDYIVKNVKVNPTTGNVTFYSYTSSPGIPATVTGTLSIDGKLYGEVTLPRVENTANAPTGCNQAGYPTLSLAIGYHSFDFKFVSNSGGNISTNSGSVYVSSNACSVEAIYTYYFN